MWKIKSVCSCLGKNTIKPNIGCINLAIKQPNRHSSINYSKPQGRQTIMKNQVILLLLKIMHLVVMLQNKLRRQIINQSQFGDWQLLELL